MNGNGPVQYNYEESESDPDYAPDDGAERGAPSADTRKRLEQKQYVKREIEKAKAIGTNIVDFSKKGMKKIPPELLELVSLEVRSFIFYFISISLYEKWKYPGKLKKIACSEVWVSKNDKLITMNPEVCIK